jgi:hypothetical protein
MLREYEAVLKAAADTGLRGRRGRAGPLRGGNQHQRHRAQGGGARRRVVS